MSRRRSANPLAIPLGAIAVAIALAAEGCAPASSNAHEPTTRFRVRWMQLPHDRVRVEVDGVDRPALAELAKTGLNFEKAQTFFTVSVDTKKRPDAPSPKSMLGSYRVERDLIAFEPRFPLQRGLRYRAEFNPSQFFASLRSPDASSTPEAQAADPNSTVFFSLPVVPADTTAIVKVFPSGQRLPENLLRFYIQFSAPMSQGEAYDHIHLLDGSGRAVDFPFLEIPQELWDPRGERFTLVFDPGRVKKGLKPREAVGPILEAGKTYTLVIDGDWPDAKGNKLAGELHKTFRAMAEDAKCPDPKDWTISPPARSSEPLTLEFPEPLDQAMLARVIGVIDAEAKPIAGKIVIDREETRWRFTPNRPWVPGAYKVIIDQSLEDLAGNSIARLFEVDVFNKIEREVPAESVLSFEVKSFSAAGDGNGQKEKRARN